MYHNVLFLLLFVHRIHSSYSTNPIWLTSNYFRAGNRDVIHNMTGNSTIETFTFVFSSPLSGTPNLGYGIKAYEGSDYFGQQRFEVNRTYLDSSQFIVAVIKVGITNILKLNVPYIAIDPGFPHHLNSFDNVPINYQKGNLVNISTRSTSIQRYTNTINYTLQAANRKHNTFLQPYNRNKVLLFMTTMYFLGKNEDLGQTNLRPINLTLTSNVVSASQYQLKAILSIQVEIEKLHFSIIIFDQQDVTSSRIYTLIYKRIQLTYIGGFIPVQSEFIDNFIMGFLDFRTNKTASILDFQWQFATINGIHGVYMPQSIGWTYLTLGTNTIQTIAYTMFYIKTWVCPNQTFFDLSQNLCISCPDNCSQCFNASACNQCDQINNYFYNQSSSQCSLCDLDGCLHCANLKTCLVCDNSSYNYSLLNGLCVYFNNTSNDTSNSSIDNTTDNTSNTTDDTDNITDNTTNNNTTDNTIDNSTIDNNTIDNNTNNSSNNTNNNSSNNVIINRLTSCLRIKGDKGQFCSNFNIQKQSFTIQRLACNQLSIEFTTYDPEFISDLTHLYFPNSQLTITRAQLLQANRVLLSVSYSADIQNQTIQLHRTNSSVMLRFRYRHTLPLLHYNQQQCQFLDQSASLSMPITILGYLILFMSFMSGKMIGLQLFGVFQLAYFSLAFMDYHDLYIQWLRQFRIFNGINLIIFQQQSVLPNNVSVLDIHSSFINNLNIMMALFFAWNIVSMAIYILFRKISILKKISLHMLKQGSITFVMFFAFHLSFAAGIHWKYQMQSNFYHAYSSMFLYLSLIFSFLTIISIEIFSQVEYGQFKNKFKQNYACKLYIPISYIYRITLGMYIALQNQYVEATILVLIVPMCFLMYNIVNLPYSSVLDNYRSNIMHITQLVTLFGANYYRSIKQNSPVEVKGRMHTVAILEITMIGICVVISVIALIVQMYRKLRRKTQTLTQADKFNHIPNQTSMFIND